MNQHMIAWTMLSAWAFLTSPWYSDAERREMERYLAPSYLLEKERTRVQTYPRLMLERILTMSTVEFLHNYQVEKDKNPYRDIAWPDDRASLLRLSDEWEKQLKRKEKR